MASIVEQDTDSNTEAPAPTLRGVAAMMMSSRARSVRAVGGLVDTIAYHHEDGSAMCATCRDGEFLPCDVLEQANSVAFAWLMDLVDVRG